MWSLFKKLNVCLLYTSDLKKIKRFAQEIHDKNNDGHGFDHIERVVALAQKILLTEPSANQELVLATCYLHDTYDEKLTDDVPKQKAKVAQFLNELKIDKKLIDELFMIIDNMSFSSNLIERKTLSLNGQIVQDADRLDAMGAWGIVRTLEYGWAKNRVFYDPNLPPLDYNSKEDYHSQKNNSTLNHFYEKLFLLKDLLNTCLLYTSPIVKKSDYLVTFFVIILMRDYLIWRK